MNAMTNSRVHSERGFTLIELVIVILVIGVIGTVAVLRMQETVETARYEQTKQEMEQLALAIVGNPELTSDGARTDFGFVGDNGCLPSSLDNLIQNPGGWSTWSGPYMGGGIASTDFKRDGWNTNYLLVDTLLRSTGSGANIDKIFAGSSSSLLSNSVTGWIRDASSQPPGNIYDDSIRVILSYPNGSGSTTTTVINPATDGRFSFSGIPVGNHALRVVYVPDSDTVSVPVTVYPGRDVTLDVMFPADLW